MSRPTRSVITSLRQQRAYSTPNSQSPGEGSPDVNDTTRPISDALSGRQRNLSIQTGRLRAQRRPSPSALPPVQLPPSFFRENLCRYSEHQQPRLPFAISQDLTTEKTSRIFSRLNRHGQYDNEYTEAYFEAALEQLFARDREIAVEIANANQDVNIGRSALDAIERRIRVCSMIIDSAWHMVDAIYPAKLPEYTYTSRPFWWWHLQHGIDYKTAMENEQLQAMSKTLTTNLIYNEKLDNTLAQVLADVPVDTFAAIHSSIGTELNSPKSANFNITSSKRPITIFSLSGYKGKGIVEAMASHIAFMEKADVVHLDAQDLATIVGGYLGQSLAFSRGSLSMLGYRTAYLSGRMAQNPTVTPNRERDDPPDHDNTVISTRIAGLKSLEEDLQKVKEGGFDCFSRWEHLKIEKALQTIIDQSLQRDSLETQRPLLLHLHDSVELTMTIEGTILLNSLRKIVDSAWAEGKKIAIFGTSSLEDPSDDYNEAIHDLSQTDFVVTRYLQSNEKPSDDGTGLSTGNIAQKDILLENINNIRRMMSSLQPERGALTAEEFASYMPNSCAMRNFIIPASEVYNIARSICFYDADIKMGIETALLRRHSMGPLIQNPRQGLIQEEDGDQNYRTYDNTNATEDSKSDPKGNMKLNEYEKRIATGHINKENLRVSFSDVHVEADIISTLKLLTSLALVRPDAFSYGVLAADKIPGCLLYGPPGTGKTMLAKAVARESGANMLEVSGATINDKWVGESEKLIRAVFTLAKKLSPCVVFIDEADSLLANRSLYSNRASHREHINQFLKEWDGIEETNAFIMVATNRPYDLDDAVLRRLPRRLLIDLPLKADREVILKMLLKGEQLASCVDIGSYADRTIHYSGSDLKNVCVAAAMAAVEEENKAAEQHRGTEPYQYPARRTLKGHHFEAALNSIPASINEDMASLRLIRNFDSQYGSKRRSGAKKLMGFGIVDDKAPVDSNDARIRSDAA